MLKILTKTFTELSVNDIKRISKVCFQDGAMIEYLFALQNSLIKNPEKISITKMVTDDEVVIAWILEDGAKEYNCNLQDGEISIHAFTHESFRKKGIMYQLIENRLDTLKNCSKIVAYVPSSDVEVQFYNKLKMKYDLAIEVQEPRVYFHFIEDSKKKEGI